MFNRNQSIIVYCTIIAFTILYEHQPLLPLLAGQWNRSLSDAALPAASSAIHELAAAEGNAGSFGRTPPVDDVVPFC